MSLSSEKTNSSSLFATWSAMISVYIIWGSTYLAIRFAIETIPPFLMAGVRFLIAGGILFGIRRCCGDAVPSYSEWRSAAIIGIFLLVGGNGGVVWAEQKVASGIAALLVGTAPLWMVLMDGLHPAGRKPNRWAVFGLILGFIGIIVLIGPPQISGLGVKVDLLGALVLILASLSWAIGSLYSRQALLPNSPTLGTAMEMLTGGVGLLLLGLLTGEFRQLNLPALSGRSLIAFAYLIVFGSWIGFTAYTWLLRAAPTPLVSTYAYINPVVAILLGHQLVSEPLTPSTIIATVIVVGSVALITVSQQGSRKIKTQMIKKEE